MPVLADITVKKADGTTNVIYYAVQGAAGQAPAVWRASSVSGAQAHCPDLRIASREGPRGRTRILRMNYVYPELSLNTTTGIYSIVSKNRFTAEWELSKDAAYVTTVAESAHQLGNLMAATLVKAQMMDGQAAYG